MKIIHLKLQLDLMKPKTLLVLGQIYPIELIHDRIINSFLQYAFIYSEIISN